MASNLLSELRKHSIIDLDCNDDAVALQYKPFQDMTSNQLIVLGQLKQPQHAHIMAEAAGRAKAAQADFSDVPLADLTVDFATALLGKEVAAHLHPTGFVHAQTNVSLAKDKLATVKHARRLAQVYGTIGIPQSRVCIKIPSTAEGLQACAELENTHNIRTLATTCFCLAQGLAAAESDCLYVAPYVNPLHVHMEPATHVKYEDPLSNLVGMQVAFTIQHCLRRKEKCKTKVLAASLVTAEEIFALCGIEHITVSAAGLALLQHTQLDDRFKGIRDRSLSYDASKSDANSPYFTENLDAALQSTEIVHLMNDALQHFGKAEDELRRMAVNELQSS